MVPTAIRRKKTIVAGSHDRERAICDIGQKVLVGWNVSRCEKAVPVMLGMSICYQTQTRKGPHKRLQRADLLRSWEWTLSPFHLQDRGISIVVVFTDCFTK